MVKVKKLQLNYVKITLQLILIGLLEREESCSARWRNNNAEITSFKSVKGIMTVEKNAILHNCTANWLLLKYIVYVIWKCFQTLS